MSSSTQDQTSMSSLTLVIFSEELCRSKVISKKVKDTFASLDHERLDSGVKMRYLLQHLCKGEQNDVPEFNRFLNALERRGRGREKLSRCLRKKLCELKRKQAEKITYLDPTLRIDCQSIDTVVAEGKTTLLEVQVTPSESACYQWMKNGQPLSDNSVYSGACSAILVISNASQGIGGEYTCCVIKGLEEVISEEALLTVKSTSHSNGSMAVVVLALIILIISIMIDSEEVLTVINNNFSEEVLTINYNISEEVLTVSVPPEKKHLQMLYSKDIAEVPPDSWPPPVNNRTFINLTLIKKNIQDADDNYHVPGDMDDTIAGKEKILYEEVFGEYERGWIVLVEGRPGSGKTTLLYKLARDWAIRGDMLKNATMVFLIRLRSLANRKVEDLSDILQLFYKNHEELREKVSGDIKRSNGEGVCFLIDGLDEYHPQDENNSVIHQLFYEKEYLPQAMVIVASRPVTTQKLKHDAPVTRRIEVCGFTKEHIFEYVAKYQFSSDPSKSATLASKLKEYLNFRLNILRMCYLPVHVSMICFLHSKLKGDIPQTMTGIYELTTQLIILRKLTRSNKNAQLVSLEGLHGKDKEYFRNVCQLAFNMTMSSKQVVLQGDTEVPLSSGTDPDDTPSLGLVTIDRTAQLYGLDNSYTFLHLTLQEYLAAFYLARLTDDKQQMEMIRVHAGKKHTWMVWKFYCGMVNFENKLAQLQEISRPTHSSMSVAVNLYDIQCAFESQQRVVCDYFVKRGHGVLGLSFNIVTPADLTSLAYVISTTSQPVTGLDIWTCRMYADSFRVFLREVSNNQLKYIQTLILVHNSIGDDGAVTLAEGLKSCTNLQTLTLPNNNIGDVGAAALAKGLKSCTTLQRLELNNNNIGDVGAAALAKGLKSCTTLQTLELNSNNIGDVGAAALAAEGPCSNLQMLKLSDNNIGDVGAAALGKGLKSCSNLILLIVNNHIGNNGRAALTEGLKSRVLS